MKERIVETPELLWWERRWISTDGLQHTEFYNCATDEYWEEWHPAELDEHLD